MRQPGDLDDLGSASADVWRERVASALAHASRDVAGKPFVRIEIDDPDSEVTIPDWGGFPVRVSDCLTRKRALELLDAPGETIIDGGRGLQEEYLEWRVTRSNGVVDKVELTSELPDYWRTLAAHEPARLLELVGEFAGENVSAADVYGIYDPSASGATPANREQAFAATMLHGSSPYNDGRRAICCMAQRSNDLEALFSLAVAATNCRVIRDASGEQLRCLTCYEAIPLLGEAAQLGRGSDPVLVERFGRLAYEGRQVAFEQPIGVYLQSVEHTRLRTPSGEAVPEEWFTFSRGTEASADGGPRYQRLTFEVPPGNGCAAGDLIDVATERKIRFGGEIAELVNLVVFLRVTKPEVIAVDRATPTPLTPPATDPEGCTEVRERARELLREDHERP
jgi:hypothetical protein